MSETKPCCGSPNSTHYHGCACHEAQRDDRESALAARIEELEAECARLEAECARLEAIGYRYANEATVMERALKKIASRDPKCLGYLCTPGAPCEFCIARDALAGKEKP